MTIKAKKINNVQVRPIVTPNDLDKRPTRAKDLFSVPYHNTYLCSKKRSGKSTVVADIVKRTVGPETKVHIFCSTVFIDPTYIELRKYLDDKNIELECYTSIKDDQNVDIVTEIMEEDRDFLDDEPREEAKDNKPQIIPLVDMLTQPQKGRKRKSKYKEIRRIFLFDDLSQEIRNSNSLKKLVKEHRHMRSVILISSQYLKDIQPQHFSQLDYCLLFKNQPKDKIDTIHGLLDLSIDLKKFHEVYDKVTEDKDNFDFLYIATNPESYRMNFNVELEL